MGKKAYAQFAALPWRRGADGDVEVLLITSRETKRWVIPKGWPMDDRSPSGAAAQEAWEEAGVRGEVGEVPLGVYGYDKKLKGERRPMVVTVFPLKVHELHDKWPEKSERERCWTTPGDAASKVAEPELAAILRRFAP
jgi:8-oxo-dGTP pyrophosphatase MutT (NUDIX family)